MDESSTINQVGILKEGLDTTDNQSPAFNQNLDMMSD